MANTLQDRDWKLLLRRIKGGKCTPFLGAGACFGVLPLGSDIAQRWTQEYQYPLEDSTDLARVAQFLAVQYDPMFPKEEILETFFENVTQPDFNEPDEPHSFLACLPLPVYMTTNYDDFMVQALKEQGKNPKQELCQWNQLLKDQPSIFDTGFTPSVENPVVFHLHGHKGVPESLVLTEDDYLDFLVSISRDPAMLPPRIQEALAGTSLMFIGYRLADWSFRVLFRGLVTATESSLRRISVTVQLPPVSPNAPGSAHQRVQKYLDEYFSRIDMRVYWGTAREFIAELRHRATLEGLIGGD